MKIKPEPMQVTQPQNLGIKAARTLLAEFKIPQGTKIQPSHYDLLDEVPDPKEGTFFSHKENKVKLEPTKEALLQDIIGDKKSVIAFCCASLETDTRLSFEMDHVFPKAKIKEKQVLLLQYLNDPKNAVFAKAFMGEEPKGLSYQAEMVRYFQRDSSGTIKGTKWFFDVCYNDLNNLTHIKHHINREKSAQEPKIWFEHCFPKVFKDALAAQGGISEGIVMQRVFPPAGLDSIHLGKDSEGNKVVVYLHQGKGVGLGHFIRNWFKVNGDKVIRNSKKVHEINGKFISLLEEELRNSGTDKKTGIEKCIIAMNEVLRLAQEYRSRESSLDSGASEEERHNVTHDNLEKALNYMHSVRAAKQEVLKVIQPSDQEKVSKEFYQYCRAQGMPSFDPERLEEAKNLLTNKLKNIPHDQLISAEKLQEILQKVENETNLRVKLAAAERELQEYSAYVAEQSKQQLPILALDEWRAQERQKRARTVIEGTPVDQATEGPKIKKHRTESSSAGVNFSQSRESLLGSRLQTLTASHGEPKAMARRPR